MFLYVYVLYLFKYSFCVVCLELIFIDKFKFEYIMEF